MEGFESSGGVEGEVASVDAGLFAMVDFGEPQRLGMRYSNLVLKAGIRGRRKKEAKVNWKLSDSREERKEKNGRRRERELLSLQITVTLVCYITISMAQHSTEPRDRVVGVLPRTTFLMTSSNLESGNAGAEAGAGAEAPRSLAPSALRRYSP